MGTSSRRRLMPEACRATISLSEERRPRPINTPTSTAMGIVKIRTGGSVQRKSSAIVPAAAGVADDQVHQAHELRDEENKGEDGESQECVRGYFAAYVSIEKTHTSGKTS